MRWPVVVLLSTVAAGLAQLLGLDFPGRPLLFFWFFLCCPGLGLVRLLRVDDPAVHWTLTLALSLGLDVVVALAMLYAGLWSPGLGVGVLSAVALGGVAAELWSTRRPRRASLSGRSAL
jgi:hypothetical protein